PAFNLSQDQTLEFNPKAPKITDFEYSISLLQTCLKNRPALKNRAPTLHRLSKLLKNKTPKSTGAKEAEV
ncbi:MAG: hypothetical protein FWH56_10315, partial [Betaproteobacteria bacterium]|nr:hypothetical protein [Betaproteobacteria bacterium]